LSYEKSYVSGIGLGITKLTKRLGLCIGLGLGLGLQSGQIFRFISQATYLICRYLVDGAEYKSHLGKKFAVTFGLWIH